MTEIPKELYADLVILNANVITVNPKDTITKAVAVKGDRIIKVGTSEEVKNFIGDHTKVMNLKGKTVVPGFVEPHAHFMGVGQRMRKVN